MRASIAAAAAFAAGVAALPQTSYATTTTSTTETTTTTVSTPTTTNWATFPPTWTQSSTTWHIKSWSSVTWSAPVIPESSTCSPSTVTETASASSLSSYSGSTTTTSVATTTAGECMSAAEATVVANNFAATIGETFNKTFVRETFAKDFTDYSDSVIELIDSGCSTPDTLGTATFTSRHAFIEGQSGQAPIPFEILNYWTGSCTEVTIRWRSSPGPGTVEPEQEVTGIIAIETKANPDTSSSEPWLIQTVYSEFNSGAWLYDLGVFVPDCSSTKKAKRNLRLF